MAILVCAACAGPLRESGATIFTGAFADGARREASHYCEWCTAVLRRWAVDHASACRRQVPYRATQLVAFYVRSLVCQHFCVREADLEAKCRVQKVAAARAVAMYLTRRLGDLSTTETGALFCRDHSTVIYAIRGVAKRAEEQGQFRLLLERMEIEVRGRIRERLEPVTQEFHA